MKNLQVQTRDWRTFDTVATYNDSPMHAEADAAKLIEAGYRVRVSTWPEPLRQEGRSKVWTGADHDWAVLEG